MIKFKYMKLDKSILTLLMITFVYAGSFAQVPGVYDLNNYFPFLKNQNVGLVVNQTSVLDDVHLLDTLISLGVNIVSIFSPEHGFSGTLNAGEYVNDSIYNQSIPIISLYGKNKKLKDRDLHNLDVILFDIQDVGVRFYTYISTLHYVMEGCAKNNIKLIVLDRLNPHAHYVDGPVLKKEYFSFVGMHSVPIVYGMTIGEYALMINGEGWLIDNLFCDLSVVKNSSYSRYSAIDYDFLPPPSPNLRTMNAVLLYPSLCLFEGTLISVGRGSETPFEIFGAPFLNQEVFSFSFLPQPNFGSNDPKYNNKLCYGRSLKSNADTCLSVDLLNLNYLIYAYQNTPDNYKSTFFNSFFNKLAGNNELKQQIVNGLDLLSIRRSWESDLKEFKAIRSKYLLYD
ncbi:MAG: hypothetical protein CMP56_00585 [Flavobacteriales bacterium]|nr:hypothetical protein [Flavobacteriales bacterium]